ncbi:Uma2 family endonuclease [Pseudanabaena yagii]|uniref:Uma2 family endonuclease n=1 Tax=Pseudanabaena yagii GIHE-NHR1 TaxID=2722753 RepID=A0ABX1LWC2_9CYAN|nr:Uma2 family endonuclease [Pseudanabaena yagii]NMF60485.1 Uma2 family endonuclease [Pseudanabaena yagii GIHE-NHR1]
MVSQLTISSTEVIYPESDGQPMASNTTHFIWIVTIKENLDWFFSQNQNSDLKIFVAGDLLWYPVEGRNDLSTAPDIMVAIGRPRGHRGSYKQWLEDNIAPQIVFEILSPSNTKEEMDKKLLFYDRYGVQEYYIYDYEANRLLVWLRQSDSLSPLVIVRGWQSPRLGIQFEITDETLKMFHADGTPFLNYAEIQDLLVQERQRADAEKQRADRLEAKLRELGIEP